MAYKHRDPAQSVHVIDCYFLKSRTDCVGGHTHTKLKKQKNRNKKQAKQAKQNKTKQKKKKKKKKRLRKIGLTGIRTRTLGTS